MNVNHITTKNFENYCKGSKFYENFEILGDGKSTFESLVIKTVHEKIDSSLLPILHHASKAGTQVDLQDIFQRFTFDNISSISLGFDPNSLPNNFTNYREKEGALLLPEVAFEKAFNKIEDAIFYRHIVPRWLWKLQKWLQIGPEKSHSESQQIIDKFLHECISSRLDEEKEKSMFNNNKNDESNFDMLKALVKENGGEMRQIDSKRHCY
ncbi:hypothetical protein PIB30_096606 [Stylosanthes scabra]|uniref:Uncharacterized protein n=1 Tax=Stylosanthes scabra TaxID=79078 RepID=A0ABU6TWN4_9FABA|nr:hypothetical protein [Stylosanthes scabra]